MNEIDVLSITALALSALTAFFVMLYQQAKLKNQNDHKVVYYDTH